MGNIYGPHILNVSKKLTRDALSGVDLFTSAYELLSQQLNFTPVKIDFAMRQYLFNSPSVIVCALKSVPSHPAACAQFNFQSENQDYSVLFYESSTASDQTYTFDEDSIKKACSVFENRVVFRGGDIKATTIQIFATMSKLLYNQLNLKNADRLILTRVQLERYTDINIMDCAIQFRFLKMQEFNISEILVKNKILGTLYWKV